PVTPGGTGSLGFPLSFAPSRAGPGNARQGGDRPGHCLDYVPGISQPPSTYSLTTCDLTSHEHGDLRAAIRAADAPLNRPESATCLDRRWEPGDLGSSGAEWGGLARESAAVASGCSGSR